ncbi:MAG: hypothetical protein QOD38_502, partial [Acidimicrobiaceae bacterium]
VEISEAVVAKLDDDPESCPPS